MNGRREIIGARRTKPVDRARNDRPVLRLLLCALVLAACFARGELAARPDDSQLNLSWKNVPGARGYIVQIRDVGGKKVLDRKTQASEIEFRLPPGDYTVRMAAVNKFNKPSAWSEWQDIRIRLPVSPELRRLEPNDLAAGELAQFTITGRNFFRETEIYLERGDEIFKFRPEFVSALQLGFALSEPLALGEYDLVMKNPGGAVSRSRAALRVREKGTPPADRKTTEPGKTQPGKDADGFYWQAYVPGLPESGNVGGYVWPGAIAGLLAAGGVEYYNAEVTRRQIVNDPMFPFYYSPALLVAAAGSGVSAGGTVYSIVSLSRLDAEADEYRDQLQRASLYGGAALLLYAGHALRFKLGFTAGALPAGTMVPGLADLQAGAVLPGAAWMTGFVGAAALAVQSYNQANANVSSLENDIFYRAFNDPILLAGLRLSNTNRREVVLPAYLATLRHQRVQREYAANQNRFGLASGAAALIYFGHYWLKQPEAKPPATESFESGTSMRLDVHPESRGKKNGTRAELRFQLRFE